MSDRAQAFAAMFAGYLAVTVTMESWLWKRRVERAEMCRLILIGLARLHPGRYSDPSPFPHFHLFRRSPHHAR